MATSNDYKRTLYTGTIKVAANVMMLVAIFFAMYQAFLHPTESLVVFCIWFFAISIVTWVVARFLMKYVRQRFADSDEGMVKLPKQRRSTLVRWKVSTPVSILERCKIQS